MSKQNSPVTNSASSKQTLETSKERLHVRLYNSVSTGINDFAKRSSQLIKSNQKPLLTVAVSALAFASLVAAVFFTAGTTLPLVIFAGVKLGLNLGFLASMGTLAASTIITSVATAVAAAVSGSLYGLFKGVSAIYSSVKSHYAAKAVEDVAAAPVAAAPVAAAPVAAAPVAAAPVAAAPVAAAPVAAAPVAAAPAASAAPVADAEAEAPSYSLKAKIAFGLLTAGSVVTAMAAVLAASEDNSTDSNYSPAFFNQTSNSFNHSATVNDFASNCFSN